MGRDRRRAHRLRVPARRNRRAVEDGAAHQFHDILPGTSIAWVHREVVAEYARRHPGRRGDHRRRAGGTGGRRRHPDRAERRAVHPLGHPHRRRRGRGRAGPGHRHRERHRVRGGLRALQRPGHRRDFPRGPDHLRRRPRHRPRNHRRGHRGQPVAAAPGLPEHVGCLGHRQVLPQPGHRPARTRCDHAVHRCRRHRPRGHRAQLLRLDPAPGR